MHLQDLAEPLVKILNEIQVITSDDQGFFDFIDALDEVTTASEVQKWQEKN